MDNNPDGHLLITKSIIDDNRQASDGKMKEYESKLDKNDSIIENLTALIENMVHQNQ